VAQTLSTDHWLKTAGQAVDFAVFAGISTLAIPIGVVSGARDCPQGRFPLVSAAPTLLSARLWQSAEPAG
jgi:hypothetical protein